MRLAIILALVAASACKKKEPAPAAAPAPAAEPELGVAIPQGPEAKALAQKLVANGLSGVNPTGSSEFSMAYSFGADGKWTGKGHANLGGETLDCDEAGTWRIDVMEGAQGVVEWTLLRSNCPNRSVNDVQRALVGFDGREATISFR